MNKKQIMISTLLLSLIMCLVLIQGFFDNNFSRLLLKDNNMGQYKEYSIEGTKYKLSIPERWIVNKTNNNLFCQIEIKDVENDILGYFQIIDTKSSVDALANNYIENLLLPPKGEKISRFSGNNWSGKSIVYTNTISNGYSYNNNIYYIELCNGNIGKLTFLVKQDKYKNNMKIIFDNIVDSIRCIDNKDLPLQS